MTSLDSARIRKAKQAARETTFKRSDGKNYTPPGVTPEFVIALLEQAGSKGLTPRELVREFEHRDTPPYKLLKRYVEKRIIVQRDGSYILAPFAPEPNKPR